MELDEYPQHTDGSRFQTQSPRLCMSRRRAPWCSLSEPLSDQICTPSSGMARVPSAGRRGWDRDREEEGWGGHSSCVCVCMHGSPLNGNLIWNIPGIFPHWYFYCSPIILISVQYLHAVVSVCTEEVQDLPPGPRSKTHRHHNVCLLTFKQLKLSVRETFQFYGVKHIFKIEIQKYESASFWRKIWDFWSNVSTVSVL